MLMSRFARLKWISEYTLTLDVVTHRYSSRELHLMNSLIVSYKFYYMKVLLSSRSIFLNEPRHPSLEINISHSVSFFSVVGSIYIIYNLTFPVCD